MFQVLLAGAGGFLGAICRFVISQRLNRPIPHFPVGTLTVNLAGAFLLGLIAGCPLSGSWVLFLGTGFMGSFTTFSTFKWESVQLSQYKKWQTFLLYLGVSYTAGILLAFAGYALSLEYF
ncbi:fluoride efflux transporter CrcB [Thermoactinomyces mirandus]|uniref:Fluoride-specific ion channel FluC n=1 Tax=Thermoactinomyces mirandus TaxID=2756294 RepID=A0A7W2AR21_9BACL|nr:fluoride efflux transporter CrcB [Thermoactinomyces mirandus]